PLLQRVGVDLQFPHQLVDFLKVGSPQETADAVQVAAVEAVAHLNFQPCLERRREEVGGLHQAAFGGVVHGVQDVALQAGAQVSGQHGRQFLPGLVFQLFHGPLQGPGAALGGGQNVAGDDFVQVVGHGPLDDVGGVDGTAAARRSRSQDRKSTRLNSSHVKISYAVFCLKKKNII